MGTLQNIAANAVADLTNTPVEKVTGRKTHKSKSQREREADSAGLKGTFRDQYVNTSRVNTYNDTFWDGVRKFFGGKLGSEEFQEGLDLKDQELINTLLDSQRQQEFNSEEAQAERLRNAGINPDLDGGASLSPSEAAQIDDETFGAGLQESLGSIQNKASTIYSDAATVFMNGATSVLGLIRGGFDLSTLAQDRDYKSLTSLFDFGQKVMDNLFNPISPSIESDPYFARYKDKDGNFDLSHVNWVDYYRKSFGLSNRAAKQLSKFRFPNRFNSSKYRSNEQVMDSQTAGAERSFLEDQEVIEGYLGKTGRSLDQYSPNAGVYIDNLSSNSTFQEFVQNSARLKLQSMKAGIAEQQSLAKYYEELNRTPYAKRRALKESYLQKMELQEAKNRMTAAQQVAGNIQRLVTLSEKGDWMATLMLQSVISGSFQSYGLGDPMEVPMWLGDKVSGLASDILNFASKGLFKPNGAAGKTAKAAKAFAGDSSVDSAARAIAKKAAAAAAR